MAVHWVLLACVGMAAATGFVNPGTPPGVPPTYDCLARQQAWEFGKATLPSRGDFRTLYDALQLQACNVTTPPTVDAWVPPRYPTPQTGGIFVDPAAQPGGDGSKAKPFSTIADAVNAAAGKSKPTILLRAGTYHSQMIVLTSVHSGLTIQNFEGEEAVVSGGVPIRAAKDDWKRVNSSETNDWVEFPNMNNVYGRAVSHGNTADIKYLGSFQSMDDCLRAANTSSKGTFLSVTWHSVNFRTEFKTQCFGIVSEYWNPVPEEGVFSAKRAPNLWVLDLSGQNIATIPGLRVNGQRAIRAKYPDGNPELSGPMHAEMQQYKAGWITADTEWIPPLNQDEKWNDTTNIVITGKDWPSVNWPMAEEGGSKWTGEGDWGEYHLGMNGFCKDIYPPFGYWCSTNPPRGQCYDHKTHQNPPGCVQTHMSPSGVKYHNLLPNAASYSNPKGAVVQVWRGNQRWYTNLCLVESQDKEAGTLSFNQEIGCNQGGEGQVTGQEWWIENVKEECDSADEFFYEEDTQKLYYVFNGTSGPTGQEQFVATRTKVVFNITGSQQTPVRDVTIRGIVLRDTALTYLGTDPADIHGMPSGGDWALERSGVILLEGTEFTTIDGCLLTRIDGNCVFISNYNLNTTVSRNEFSWLGQNAIAAWGSTGDCLNEKCDQKLSWGVGPDGRNRNQPYGTHLVGNLVREVAIWQKQSSMYFQAVATHTHIERNVHFNGPRAGLNFNDGFAGGDVIEGNLILNCVRESGDHGPWNSWDRIPYITLDGMRAVIIGAGDGMPGHVPCNNTPTVVPKFREIRHNFIDIDTDDGSSYYQTHDNYFVYADSGLKTDFGGQWNHHFRNVYGYVGGCFNAGQNLAFYNNTCVTRKSKYQSTCGIPETMTVEGNAVYTPDGKCKMCSGDTSTCAKYPADQYLGDIGLRSLKPYPIPVTPPPSL